MSGLIRRRGLVSAAAPATSFAFQASATSVLSTITGPASIIAGDLLVLSDYVADSSSAPAVTVPAGFSVMQNAALGNIRHVLSRKIADGSEASASLTGMSADTAHSKILFVFRPDNPLTTVSDASGGAQFTSSNPSAQNIVASGGTPPLIVIGAYVAFDTPGPAAVNPRTFSPTKDGEVQHNTFSGFIDHWLAYKIYNSSPADVSIDMDDEGTNSLQSRYVQGS